MAGYAGWENNEVRTFGGTNGLQVQALSQETCELTLGVQVIASSAAATRFFWLEWGCDNLSICHYHRGYNVNLNDVEVVTTWRASTKVIHNILPE